MIVFDDPVDSNLNMIVLDSRRIRGREERSDIVKQILLTYPTSCANLTTRLPEREELPLRCKFGITRAEKIVGPWLLR